MTFRKLHFAVVVLAAVVLAPATAALAEHVFVDVPDSKFYAEASEWAKVNGITTGSPAGSSTFKPEDPVTRGETVTFMRRYDSNVVQPALAAQSDNLDGLESRQGRVVSAEGGVVDNWPGDLLAESVVVNAPEAGYLVLTYLVNLGPDVDSTDTGTEVYGADIWVDREAATNLYMKTLDFLNPNSDTLVVRGVVAVDKGEHLVVGFINKLGGASTTSLGFVVSSNLTAVYVPFDGNGEAPPGGLSPLDTAVGVTQRSEVAANLGVTDLSDASRRSWIEARG